MPDVIPQRFEDLTPAYLTDVLRGAGALDGGAVVACRVEPLGAGVGFAGALARLHLAYAKDGAAGPATVVAKLPGPIRRNRALVELGQGHEREVRFYRELAAGDCGIATPRVFAAECDPDPDESARDLWRQRVERLPAWLLRCVVPLALWRAGRSKRRYLLLLEDVGPEGAHDQLRGVDLEAARPVAKALAGLHARFWHDPALETATWLPRPDWSPRSGHAYYRSGRRRFARELGAALPARFALATDWVDAHLEAVLAHLASPPWTLLHGDFRLDNLLRAGDRIVAVDWQSVGVGRAALDWAYFATGSLAPSVDASGEETLLAAYHDALLARGVRDYSFETCRRDYALSKLLIAFGHVAASHLLSLDGERGSALLDTIRTRVIDRTPPPPWAWLL
jgi:hypothetical protein